MKTIIPFCLTLTILLGSAGMSASADFQKGLTAYESGDYATALREWYPLAEQGHATAQTNLGVMYHYGKGVPKDHKTAAKWYRLAAEQGNADAQTNLGVMYTNGEGVTRDYVYAYMWLNIAASNGDKEASRIRDILARRTPDADISAAQKLARECIRKKYKGC